MPHWALVVIRALGLFILTLVIVRLMGKKQMARLSPYNFVTYMIIGIMVSLLAVGLIQPAIFGFLALGTWVVLFLAIEFLMLKSKWVHDWVSGKETILIKQGKVMEENLLQVRMTGEELLAGLRAKNVFNLGDVEFAVMESTGDINALLKSDKKPATPYDLKKTVAPEAEAQTVVLDGNIMDEPLANLGLNRQWLTTQLESKGVSLENVFLAQVDTFGELYLDLFDDAIQIPESKVKELLFATLEKSLVDLKGFAIETLDEEAKKMYINNAKILEGLIKKLRPYLSEH